MHIISATVKNFGSYAELDFNFDAQGLCLVQGSTGSGKSTLCDIVPWLVFGKTAKDGSVDEVRSWYSDSTTEGTVYINTNTSELTIYRSRAPNDLYFRIGASSPQRGKDITDTQKMINEMLGFDYDTYTTGAYFHEFSKTASFFNSTAKTRRAILDQIVDLSLAQNLQDKASKTQKELKKEINQIENDSTALTSKMSYIASQLTNLEIKNKNFELTVQEQETIKDRKITILASEIVSYEEKLNKLEAKKPHNTCEHCGSVKDKTLVQSIRQYEDAINKNIYNLETLQQPTKTVNTYPELIAQNKANQETYTKELDVLAKTLCEKDAKLQDLTTLLDMVDTYRASVVSTTVGFLEDNTNMLLSNHFDAELKVTFAVESSDKLDVLIYKDGNECSYTQLSKGQRQLLKLCFGLSIMKCVANHKGVQFNSIFLDEALDGLDETLKVKAYGLLQNLQLSYSSIFVVEHSTELKALFEKSFKVTNTNGMSVINEI